MSKLGQRAIVRLFLVVLAGIGAGAFILAIAAGAEPLTNREHPLGIGPK